jgi:regulator of nucleoside diphosphate kinase
MRAPDPDRRPPILLARSDRAVLERAAVEALLEAPRIAGALLDELDRAQVLPDSEVGPEVERLGSVVTFREAADGAVRTIRLIGPEPSLDRGEVSVLTSTGAALLGLRVGQSILWADRVGSERTLTILATYAGAEKEDPS